MHVRFSTARGMSVVAENGGGVLGVVDGIVLHPDLGTVEGFFVRTNGFLQGSRLFLPALDIQHWGTRVRVRSEDVLANIDDLVRLQSLLADGRRILGQRIVTDAGRRLGRCRDVQFETKTFRLESIILRRFLRWHPPLPVSSILEVRRDAVVVRDPLQQGGAREPAAVLTALKNLEVPVPPQPEAS